METHFKKDGDHLLVALSGNFNYDACGDFCQAVEAPLHDPQIRHITLNLQEVSYLDSCGLGALLILREKVAKTMKKIELTAARDNVRHILSIANFQKIFSIS